MISFSSYRRSFDVFNNRRDPDSVKAHSLNVIQFADDSLPVATAVFLFVSGTSRR